MKLKLFLSAIILLFFHFANAQNLKFGTTLNLGFSSLDLTTHSKLALSGNVGLVIEKQFKEVNRVGVEFLFFKMQGLEREVGANFNIEARTLLDYIGGSIYYAQQFDKLILRFGIQPIINTDSKSYSHLYVDTGNIINREFKDNDPPKFELGPKVGFDYIVSESIRFKFDFFHGLLESKDGNSTIRKNPIQFTIGVFSFFNSNRKKSRM